MTYVKKTKRLFKTGKLDFDSLRFDGEISMVKILEDDYALSNYYDIFDQEDEVIHTTSVMVANAVHLNHLLAPRLYNTCKDIKNYLQFEDDIDFYLASSQEVNAFSINGFGFEPHIICLTSSLINMVSDEELKFVIGHEIGHLIYNHSKLDIVMRAMANKEDSEISNSLSYNLIRWQKYAEISADRVGYLVCPDPKVIGKLFFKFAAGLSEEALNFDVDEYLKQMNKLKDLAAGDFFATHPNNLVRIKSLMDFSESEFLKEEFAKGKTYSKEKLETMVLEHLNSLELHPRKDIDKKMVEFLAMVGYYVTYTPEGVPDTKLYLISELLGKYTSQPEAYLKVESFKELKERVDVICKFFANRHDGMKYTLIEHIILFAISDGRMETEEKQIIYEIGKKLKISEDEVTQTIRRTSETYLSPKKRTPSYLLKP